MFIFQSCCLRTSATCILCQVHRLGQALASRGVQLATKTYLHPFHSSQHQHRSRDSLHALAGLSPAEVTLVEAHLVRCSIHRHRFNDDDCGYMRHPSCKNFLPLHQLRRVLDLKICYPEFVVSATGALDCVSRRLTISKFPFFMVISIITVTGLLCCCFSRLPVQCHECSCSAPSSFSSRSPSAASSGLALISFSISKFVQSGLNSRPLLA